MYRSRSQHSVNAQEPRLRDQVIYDDGSRTLERGYTHCEQRYNARVWTVVCYNGTAVLFAACSSGDFYRWVKNRDGVHSAHARH